MKTLAPALAAFLLVTGPVCPAQDGTAPAVDGDSEKKAEARPTDGSAHPPLRFYWKDGLRLEAPDGRFKLKIGGRIQFDWAVFSEEQEFRSGVGDNGAEIRRGRLLGQGEVGGRLAFKVEYDFAGGDAQPKDVYLDFTGIPGIGHIQAGHFKEPFSLEELVSSNSIMFLERGLPNALAPGRHVGLMIGNAHFDERVTWAAGVFRETDGFGGFNTADNAVTLRGTWLPLYGDGGARLVHVGAAFSERFTRGTVRYRERPEAHLANRLVDTGRLEADRVHLLGLEGAVVHGPFSLQSEFIRADVDSGPAGDPAFHGFYAEAAWLLTGEHRAYRKSLGVFDSVKPGRSLGRGGGSGAWEILLRYSLLDLNATRVSGGLLRDLTAGLTWFVNPYGRIMFNYVLADVEDVGRGHAFQMRFQVAF